MNFFTGRRRARGIGAALCVLALAVATSGAFAQEPPADTPQPKMLGVQGFIIPAKKGGFRVGALIVARYPSVDGVLPDRVRAELNVSGDDGSVIASARDRGSAPVRKNKNSFLFIHVMSFPRDEGKAIIAAEGKPSQRARLGAQFIFNYYFGDTLGGGTFSGGLNFAKQPKVPEVVKNCPIGPYANCTGSSLDGADLRNADLKGATLDRARLYNANLSGANLAGATLIETRLERAQLPGANLEGVDAFRADFDHADLSNANLTRAKIIAASVDRTNFKGAKLTGADFSNTNPSFTICPDGSTAVANWPPGCLG